MRIGDLEVGDWFEHCGGFFIKTHPFMRAQCTFQAVSLVDGVAAFMVRTSTADHQSIGQEEVLKIEKPDWAANRWGSAAGTD